jgi:hypothetical protein
MGELFSYLIEGLRELDDHYQSLRRGNADALHPLFQSACRTLSRLDEDPEFIRTLTSAKSSFREHSDKAKEIAQDVRKYSIFLSREMRLLEKLGVKPDVVDALRFEAEELRQVLNDEQFDLERIQSTLRTLKQTICREADVHEGGHEEWGRRGFYFVGGAMILFADAAPIALGDLGAGGVALSGVVGSAMIGVG